MKYFCAGIQEVQRDERGCDEKRVRDLRVRAVHEEQVPGEAGPSDQAALQGAD